MGTAVVEIGKADTSFQVLCRVGGGIYGECVGEWGALLGFLGIPSCQFVSQSVYMRIRHLVSSCVVPQEHPAAGCGGGEACIV